LRCEDEESSESEKVHLENMSLVPLAQPVSTKQQVHAFPGPGCSEYQLYQEDGRKGSLGQHPSIEDLPCEPAWLLHACTLPPNSPVLLQGIVDLSKQTKMQNLDVIVHGHLVMMISVLWVYTAGKEMDWCEASLLAATAAGKRKGLMCSLCKWVWDYLEDNEVLLVNLYGHNSQSLLEDEDIMNEVNLHLHSLDKKTLKASKIVHYLARPDVMERLHLMKAPSE